MNDPAVSVLMTAYNREQYIGEAIESVLSSSFSDFELLIADDGSTDATLQVAWQFAKKDARIKVIENKQNLGDYANRNHVAKLAKGKYIKYLDSDDYFLKDGLAYCVNSMINNPEADWGMFYELNKIDPKVLTPDFSIRSHFFQQPFLLLGPGATIMKRQFFYTIGMYPDKYGPANDLYFNLKAASKGSLLLLTKAFFYYRLHQDQERNNKYLYLVNLYNHLNDAIQELDLGLTTEERAFILKKNKRRFLTNTWEYFIHTGNLKRIKQASREVKFQYSDVYQAIFQK